METFWTKSKSYTFSKKLASASFSLTSPANTRQSSPELITLPVFFFFFFSSKSKKSNHFYMCQTSSLISQTKAGEFDLSEFRSFVPMNKTLLLLDVTRTYQVTDSPFELSGDTVQDETEKMKLPLHIFSFSCAGR